MNTGKIFKYIAYALGEIILIVAGINIALHFDNKNKDEQTQQELHKVYDIISHDLELDTTDLGNHIAYYEGTRWIYDSVLTNAMSPEILDTCYICRYPAIFTRNLSFYDRGFKLLIGNAKFNSLNNDSLNGTLMEYYDYVKGHLEDVTQRQIRDDAEINVDYWKLNYDWFHDMETNPEFVKYTLNDPKYLNMVKKHHFLIYNNYLPDLRRIKDDAASLIESIKKIKPQST